MLRIGIDGREFEKGKITGIGRYLLDFLKFATENKQGWKFILFCNQYTGLDFDAKNLEKITIPEKVTFFWDQIKLPYYLRKEKIDIFLTPYFKAPVFAPCKLVVIINDLIPIKIQNSKFKIQNFLGRLYFWILGKMAAKRADKIITISNYSKKDIIGMFKVAEGKIEVVYLGVDKRYHPVESNLKEVTSKYGINKRYILYIGNLSPHKNIRGLITAYSKLPDNIKDEYDLVIGGKKDRNYLDLYKLTKDLDLEDKVIFTGFIEEDDLPLIYSGAELFAFPSFYEGFGLPPLEAMACGTTVVASNAASLPEVVGDAGLLVSPENIEELYRVIWQVLTNSKLKKNLTQKGLERVKLFNLEKTGKEILEVLEGESKTSSIKNILIIFMGGIGNMILFTPALRALKEKFPYNSITLLVGPFKAEEVVEKSSLIDKVIIYDYQKYRGLISKIKFIKELGNKRFDLTLTATGMNPFKSSLLAFLIRGKYRIGENIKGLGIFYNIKIKYNENLSEVDGNINLLKPLQIEVKEKNLLVCTSEDDKRVANEFFLQHQVKESGLIVGMHPGSGHFMAYKRWAKENFAELGDKIHKRYGAKIVIFGGPEEVELGNSIANLMKIKPLVLCGRTTLGQTAELIRKCNLFVSNDSGLMHIAVAMGTPLVAIFGPTGVTQTGPYTDKDIVIRKNLRCSPCYHYSKVRCKTLECLNSITVEDVMDGVERQLSRVEVKKKL